MYTTKGQSPNKKEEPEMVKFYLNKELFSEDYKETGINRTMFWAVMHRKKTGNKLLDLSEAINDNEIPELVDTLLRMEEKQFTISSEFSGLVKTLKEFEKYGAYLVSLTEVNTPHKDFKTGERERIPALLLELR